MIVLTAAIMKKSCKICGWNKGSKANALSTCDRNITKDCCYLHNHKRLQYWASKKEVKEIKFQQKLEQKSW